MQDPPPPAPGGVVALLGRPPYLLFVSGRFLGTLATGAQAVTLAWQVYETARQTMPVEEASLTVGLIGLAQFLPLLALTLVAGETADRHDRRLVLTLCFIAQYLTSAALAGGAYLGAGLWPVFALAGAFGCARAFFQPV